MFTLSKLKAKAETSINKKKNRQNLQDKNKQSVKDNFHYEDRAVGKPSANGKKMHVSEKNFSDDIYVLKYKRDSAFFAQDSDDCSEILSTINILLQNSQLRSSCFPMLEIAIEGCTHTKLSQNVIHWTTSLMNIFMTSSSKQEKETVCSLIVKIIPKLHATQESNQLLNLICNHVIGKSVDEENVMNDSHLLLKVNIVKEFLFNLPSLCGQHKAKLNKYFSLLINHQNISIQQIAAQCLALVPSTGGSGSSGQAHQDGWSIMFDRILTDLKDTADSIEKELTGKSTGKSYFSLVHKVSGLVKTLIALLMQPNVKHFESRRIFDVIDQMLNIKMVSGPIKPYILQLHKLAFSILEMLLSRYCELLAFNSNIIYNHMNQVLRDTCRKTSDDRPKFCSLRRSVYVCLKLCFLHNIFPFSMTSLSSIIKSMVKDCIFPVVIADSSTSIANKMILSTSSKEAYMKKKKNKNNNLDSILDDLPRNGGEIKSSGDEVEMCVAALEALTCFVSSDSKLLHLSIVTEDKSVYPLVFGDESKQETIMKTMVMPVWKFIIPQVRKLNGVWNINPSMAASSSLGIYNSSRVKRGLFQLLGSLISLPFLRESEAFGAAYQLIRIGSNAQSDVEVQELCRQTLQWLSFSLDCIRHEKVPPSKSFHAAVNEYDASIEMENEEAKEQSSSLEICLPVFNEILVKDNLINVTEDENLPDDDELEEIHEDIDEEDNDDQIVNDAEDKIDIGCLDEISKKDDLLQNSADEPETKLNNSKQHLVQSKLSLPVSPFKRKLDHDDCLNDDAKRAKIGDTSSSIIEVKDNPEIMKLQFGSETKEFYENVDINLINMEFDPTWK